MSVTIQKSIKPMTANEINAEETNILSAKGSKNLPVSVTISFFRA